MLQNKKITVVVIGAGFGGLNVARQLSRRSSDSKQFEIILIHPVDYFLFTPLLHEVAIGSVDPDNVIEPLADAVRPPAVKVVQGWATRVQHADQTVETTAGNFPYDYLVIATGSGAHFYGNVGAEKHAYALKDLSDALAMKQRLASLSANDPVVVVGGGATGVEMAAEFSEVRPTFLLEGGSELLRAFSPPLRHQAREILERKGVRVRCHAVITDVTPAGVQLTSGEQIACGMTVWAAGIMSKPIDADQPWKLDKGGRIHVDATLRPEGHPHVFVIGDGACVMQSDQPLPPLAQVATKQAAYVVECLRRLAHQQALEPFVYHSAGSLVSLGRWSALAEIYGIRFKGFFAWWLWRTIYLSKFFSWNKKIRVAANWTRHLFCNHRLLRKH